MGKSKVAARKKKGPKGKRARAKAKLERQWGEQYDDSKVVVPLRKGKSRLLQQQEHVVQEQDDDYETTRAFAKSEIMDETVDDHDGVSSSGSSSASSVDDDDDDMAADYYSTLMKSIKTTSTRRRDDLPSSSSSDERDSDDSSDEESEDDDDEIMANESGDDEEEDNNDDVLMVDPFTERFSREPLPEDKIDATLKALQQETVKIATPDNDSSRLEMQVSKELASKAGIAVQQVDGKKNNKAQTTSTRKFLHFYRELLQRNWKLQQQQRERGRGGLFDKMQTLLFPLLSSYADILMTTTTTSATPSSSSYRQTYKSREKIQAVATFHILNHVLTSRGRIYRHNNRRRIVQQKEQDDSSGDDNIPAHDQKNNEEEDIMRDQGFTRPTVLVLLPTRSCCYDFVQTMVSLLHGDNDGDTAAAVVDNNNNNMDRFETEYGKPEEVPKDAAGDNAHRQKVIRQKGPAWNELFGDDRNDDDDFKIGVQLNLKKGGGGKKCRRQDKDQQSSLSSSNQSCSIKLFCDFYKSDIILASPLGLKMTTSSSTTTDGEAEANADFFVEY